MHKLILIGGGGHCRACIDVIEATGKYEILGILDREELIDTEIIGYKIIGTDADIIKYIDQGYQFLITVGQIKSVEVREKIFNILILNEANLATIISPRAYVSKHAQIGFGTIIMHNAIVNANANVGDNCIINTGCNIEHDARIGNQTHISTSAIINGDVVIGNRVFIGSNSTVSSQVKLAGDIIVGAGSVVVKDICESGTYVGNPVQKLNV